jgi:hypothetical protein
MGAGSSHPGGSGPGGPFGVFSVPRNRFVRPISLKDASAEKDSTVATCAFQPKRPTLRAGGSSRGFTMCGIPLTPGGGLLA